MIEHGRYQTEQIDQRADSGLDLGPTIKFYKNNIDRLMEVIPGQPHEFLMDIEISGAEYMHLREDQIKGLLSILPTQAQERSILKTITGHPTQWFHRDSTAENQMQTGNIEEALSPTAIIPSKVIYEPNNSGDGFEAHIHMFKIPKDAASEDVRKIIHAQGLIHEVGHTLVTPIVYGGSDQIYRRTNGQEISALEDIFIKFSKIAENYPPISHYSSTFRDVENKFKKDPKDIFVEFTAVSEELVESLTAGLLQFANTVDPDRKFSPLVDRPEIIEIIEDLLTCKKVN